MAAISYDSCDYEIYNGPAGAFAEIDRLPAMRGAKFVCEYINDSDYARWDKNTDRRYRRRENDGLSATDCLAAGRVPKIGNGENPAFALFKVMCFRESNEILRHLMSWSAMLADDNFPEFCTAPYNAPDYASALRFIPETERSSPINHLISFLEEPDHYPIAHLLRSYAKYMWQRRTEKTEMVFQMASFLLVVDNFADAVYDAQEDDREYVDYENPSRIEPTETVVKKFKFYGPLYYEDTKYEVAERQFNVDIPNGSSITFVDYGDAAFCVKLMDAYGRQVQWEITYPEKYENSIYYMCDYAPELFVGKYEHERPTHIRFEYDCDEETKLDM